MAEEKRKKKSIIKRIIKWSLIIGLIVFVGLTVLSRLGGDSEVLQSSVEDILTEKTGYKAKINTFNRMTFYPLIAIDAESIDFFEIIKEEAEPEEAQSEQASVAPDEIEPKYSSDPVMQIGKLQVALGFFDLMLSKGRVRHFLIEDFKAEAGALLEQPISVDKIDISSQAEFHSEEEGGDEDGDEEGRGYINFTANISDKPLKGSISVDAHGMDRYKSYSVGNNKIFYITTGDLIFSAQLESSLINGLELNQVKLLKGKDKIVEGDFTLAQDTRTWKIKGQSKLYPHGTELTPDIELTLGTPLTVKGSVKSPKIIYKDVEGNSPFRLAIDEISSIISSKEKDGKIDLADLDIDLDIKTEILETENFQIIDMAAPLKIADNKINIGPLKGEIYDGDLSGSVGLNAQNLPAILNLDLKVKDFNYSALQKKYGEKVTLDGLANIAVDLNSKANRYDTLFDSAEGKVSFITGDAKLESKVLNIWGGGLLNALIPDFSGEETLDVTCAVVDMNVKDGIARSNATFMDTKKVMLTGEGQYNFKNNKLDFKISPKTKDIALVDVGAGVHLTGPIQKPRVTPSARDIGKKIGGLLLGAVNPAFFAISLVDLGLSNNHPCNEYTIQEETLDDPTKQEPEKAAS
ncbi:MAG: AsmA-like C-terminal region-containing protein [Micavibrio sp.]|nr:AsmA-like C-terminal region-containing protein [Micavibrio sp.]